MTEAQIRSAKSDIVPSDDMPKLVLESKFYKDFPFHSFASNKEIPLLDKWIKELEYDCDENDFGLLCFKINNKGWFVVVRDSYDLEFENYCKYRDYRVTALVGFLKANKEKILKLSSYHSDTE